MQTRFFLPTVGGVLGILVARGRDASTLETFGAMLVGLVVGYAIYWLTSRNTRGGT